MFETNLRCSKKEVVGGTSGASEHFSKKAPDVAFFLAKSRVKGVKLGS